MKITILATGSSGNCIKVEDNANNYIIIDKGEKVDGYVPKVGDTILFTHEHTDHFDLIFQKKMKELIKFPNVAPNGEVIAKDFENEAFEVKMLPQKHGTSRSNLLVIHSEIENKTILYGVDIQEISEYDIKKLSEIHFDALFIEANYNMEKWMAMNQPIGCENHLSDIRCLKYCKLIVCEEKREKTPIILLHTSQRASNSSKTLQKFYNQGFMNVYVTQKFPNNYSKNNPNRIIYL